MSGKISLLPDPEIKQWWDDHATDQKRQEKLRDAVKIGLEIIEGKKGIVSVEKQQLYEAIETLLRQGIITPESKSAPVPEKPPEKKEKPKADVSLLRRGRGAIKSNLK